MLMDVIYQKLLESDQYGQGIFSQIDVRELRLIPEEIIGVDCLTLECGSPNQTKADP